MSRDTLAQKLLPPAVEASKEATLSEFSYEFENPKWEICPRKWMKYSVTGGLAILFLILILAYLLPPFKTASNDLSGFGSHIAFASCGPVEGIARDGGFEYRGIPYAVSLSTETGKNRRWEPAVSVSHLDQCWKDVLPFNPNPSECFQISSQGHVMGEDDCLTLDIYTPRSGYENPSHVVVVVAVPSLAGGWPSDNKYKELGTPTAKFAAEQDIVYVVPRFRLGPLGFLPRLHMNETDFNPNITDFKEEMIKARADREAHERSYNLAVSDLVAALSWIQLNIEDFGGESRSVTLLGWGAGSTLITALTSLTNLPGYPYLFTQAWTIGGSGYPLSNVPLESRIQHGFALWENSPCNRGKYNPKCLFDLTTRDLFKSIPKDWLNQNHQWLNVDSYWLQNSLGEAWANGKITHDIPLVIGTTAEEIFQFPDQVHLNITMVDAYFQSLKDNIPKNIYEKFSGNNTLRSQFLSDLKINCPLRNLARNASKYFSSDVSFYVSSMESGNFSQFPVGLNDLAAILGNVNPRPASQTLQKLFLEFLHNAALPKNVRASDGLYIVDEDVVVSTKYGLCQNWELDSLWKKYALLN